MREKKPGMFFGWWIAYGSMVIQFLQSSLLFFPAGVYLLQLQKTFGWSKGAISIGFALPRMESGLIGPLQGWLVDRFGPRMFLRIGIVMLGGGFILLATIQSLWQFYVVFVIIALGSSLAGWLTITTSIAHWFHRQRARAMSMPSAGFAIGGLIAAPIALLLLYLGWRNMALFSGILIIITGLPVAQLFRHKPEKYGTFPDGDRPPPVSNLGSELQNGPAPNSDPGFTLKEAMRDRSFWYISIGHGTALLIVSTIPVHLVPYLVESGGWNTTPAVGVMTLITAMMLAGQFAIGLVGDKFNKAMIAAMGTLGHGVAMLMLAYTTSVPIVILAVTIHGLSWGSRGPLMMAIRADYFGRSHFATIAGFSAVLTTLGSSVGPIIAGAVNDATGSYTLAFAGLGAATTLSTVFFILARKPPVPDRSEPPV
jgi:MFS family permease